MLKLVVGFICGLCVTAAAQNGVGSNSNLYELYANTYTQSLALGRAPSKAMPEIKVDEEGRVICAPQ